MSRPARYQGRLISYTEALFGEAVVAPGTDAVTYVHAPAPTGTGRQSEVWTLLVDLSPPESDILAGFRKNTRYEIRRAEERDRVVATVQLAPGPSDLAGFVKFFEAFALRKGIEEVRPRRLEGYRQAGRLTLTRVCSRGGAELVWHAYCHAGDRIHLMHSAQSAGADPEARAALGRANRWLHWWDMRAFKAAGFRVYDLGGWYEGRTDTELLAINGFKEQFGGQRVREFESVVPLTVKGRLYIAAQQAVGRRG